VGGGSELDKDPRAVGVDTSGFDPLLGMSSYQFGALARSNHKCQGAGQLRALPGTGRAVLRAGRCGAEGQRRRKDDVLAAVETSLSAVSRFARGQEDKAPFLAGDLRNIEDQARQAQEAYSTHAADRMRTALRAGARGPPEDAGSDRPDTLDDAAKYEITTASPPQGSGFRACADPGPSPHGGVTSDDGDVVPGQSFTVHTRVWNQGMEPVALEEVALRVPAGWTAARQADPPAVLETGKAADVAFKVTVATGARYAQPYWRRNPKVDRYDIDNPADFPLPWSPPDVVSVVRYGSPTGPGAGSVLPVTLEQPALFRYEGRWVGGEKQKVVNVVPALSVSMTPEIAVMPLGGGARREFRVTVANAAKSSGEAVVRLEVPAGWKVEPVQAAASLRFEGDEATARFFVTAPADAGRGRICGTRGGARAGGRSTATACRSSPTTTSRSAISSTRAASRVQAIDVKVAPAVSIGYVLGAGDEVPPAIQQIGISPTLLSADDLAYGDLSRYSTIVTGIRAYQTRKDLRANNQRLIEYARAGGHVVVQYNKFEFNRLSEAPPEGFSGGGIRDRAEPVRAVSRVRDLRAGHPRRTRP
jgi:hypothetical protein